jgi:hypothetical protein
MEVTVPRIVPVWARSPLLANVNAIPLTQNNRRIIPPEDLSSTPRVGE